MSTQQVNQLISDENFQQECSIQSNSYLSCNTCKFAVLSDFRFVNCQIHKTGFSIMSWCTEFIINTVKS
jgi:hypothetical protein